MCDSCVSSTPVTYNSTIVRARRLGFPKCNSREINHGNEFCRVIRSRNLSKSSSTLCDLDLDRFKGFSTKANSRSYELFESFDGLGFEEKSRNGSEFKSQSEDGGVDKVDVSSTSESGIRFVDEEREEKRSSEGLDSTSFDFLELENDLEKESNEGLGSLEEEEEITRVGGGSDSVGLKSEELGKVEGKLDVRRRGRQLMRRSNMLAKQVISVKSALSLGFVSQLWVDTSSWLVVVVEVRPSLLSGEIERFLLDDVYQVGDVVLIEDENVMENGLQMIGLDTLVGYSVITPSRRTIGKVRGYTFNINSGSLELLELDSFGVSIIPSSLVSTYALFVEDVIEVAFDSVMVHEAAASRLQRLTKGFWDAPNDDTSNDEFEEYDFGSTPIRSDRNPGRRKISRSRRRSSKNKVSDDDWEDLPMDYL